MDKYIKLDVIGKGCNGNSVIKVKNLEDNKIYAIKRIIMNVNDEQQTIKNMNEINIFKSLECPFIVTYYESFVHNEKFCIVMEYADGGDLSMVIKSNLNNNTQIEEELIWNYFIQILLAVKHIHSKKILHRDIKSQNIFLTKKGSVKLGDFGISKVLENTMDYAKTSLGTPYFLSPEICAGNKYNFKTDIWMLGCVLYEMSCLKRPFEGENFHKLIINILNQDILPIPKNYSEDMKNLVSILLNKDPNCRPSIEEIFQMDIISKKLKFYGYSDQCLTSDRNLLNENKLSDLRRVNMSKGKQISDEGWESSLFEFGFGNLLKENEEFIIEKNFKISPNKNQESFTSSKNNTNSRRHKYSPSYNNINDILFNINNFSIGSSLSKANPNTNLSKFSKNQNSFPEYGKLKANVVENQNSPIHSLNTEATSSPTKMTMEQKLNRIRQRNHSMNINIVKPLETNIETHFFNGTEDKNLNKNHKIVCNPSTNLNLSKNKILNQKKNIPKQINISSFQSPEQKVVYFDETENNNIKKAVEKVPNYRISFLIQQIGENKVNRLLSLIEKSTDPLKLLNGDGKEIQEIVGNNYKKVQNFLKNFILPVNSI